MGFCTTCGAYVGDVVALCPRFGQPVATAQLAPQQSRSSVKSPRQAQYQPSGAMVSGAHPDRASDARATARAGKVAHEMDLQGLRALVAGVANVPLIDQRNALIAQAEKSIETLSRVIRMSRALTRSS